MDDLYYFARYTPFSLCVVLISVRLLFLACIMAEKVDSKVLEKGVEELEKEITKKIQLFICKGVIVKKAEVNKKSELSLLTTLSCTKRKYAVECQLKSLCNGSVIKCNVDQIKGNEYCIVYTPTVRGRHELIVTVNGQEVAGSPFPVFVSIHPSQLGKPVRVITGVKTPGYLAINSVGEIIVTKVITRDVLIFDKKWKRMRKSILDIDIKHPTGVAVDDADNIYIADHVGKGVIKLNKDLKILNKIDTKQDSLLWGVSIVGDEVMVCDERNKCILVYTKELKYVRQINDPVHFEIIRDIFPDEHGNLYVCAGKNSRIRVLSNSGEYLHSFGCDGSGVNMLSGPCGIYVASQYVYVTSNGNHTISVYTTEGEHVTTFGKRGSNEGDLINPRGVCVDKDGFVYVCDASNNRVQVF